MRQLEGQSTSMTPFMMVSESYHNNKTGVSFNMQDRLHYKIDKLTSMMSKLTAQDNKQDKQFEPKRYQGKMRGQMRHNYDQDNYQTNNISNSGDRRTSSRHRGGYIQNCGQNDRRL